MKKTLILLGFSLVAALPVFAQHNEVDLLIGGAKAMKTLAGGKSDFQHGFEEISYGVSMEQDTIFKIKLGRMNAKTAFASTEKDEKGNNIVLPGDVDPKGQIEYADAVIEYRFSEPFGSTGLFAGAGLYRQSGISTSTARPSGTSASSTTSHACTTSRAPCRTRHAPRRDDP